MAQSQQINRIFQEREKKIIEEVSQIAKEVTRKELALLEFEMFNEVMVPDESKQRAEGNLQNLRQEKWKKALEKANGNEEEAMFIYGAS